MSILRNPFPVRSPDDAVQIESCDRHRALAGLADELTGAIRIWLRRWQTRRALGDLAEWNPHLLSDIGLSRAEAMREAAKPFWRK